MKTINREELIKLIESIPTRQDGDKPVFIYQAYHSGPQLFIDIAWPGQVYKTSMSLQEHHEWWETPQCKFLCANMLHFDKEFAEQCISWQKKYRKPAVVLLEKYINWFDADEEVTIPGDGALKVLSLLECVGIESYGFITTYFDVYEYSENEELEIHSMSEEKDLVKKYGIKIHKQQ